MRFGFSCDTVNFMKKHNRTIDSKSKTMKWNEIRCVPLLAAHTEGLRFRGGNGEASSLLRSLALSREQQPINDHQTILVLEHVSTRKYWWYLSCKILHILYVQRYFERVASLVPFLRSTYEPNASYEPSCKQNTNWIDDWSCTKEILIEYTVIENKNASEEHK